MSVLALRARCGRIRLKFGRQDPRARLWSRSCERGQDLQQLLPVFLADFIGHMALMFGGEPPELRQRGPAARGQVQSVGAPVGGRSDTADEIAMFETVQQMH